MNYFSALHFLFYFFSSIAVISATAVITVRHPVKSVLWLVVTFFAMAGLWMMLRAEFLSLILLLVYVGAVMTLFLFVVMMLDVEKEAKKSHFVRYAPIGVLFLIVLIGILLVAFSKASFKLPLQMTLHSSVERNNLSELGRNLYTHYLYPFEIAGVILLAAMIAAITLTHREPRHRKRQSVHQQIAVKPEDRIRLVTHFPHSIKRERDDVITQ